jgi:hypothetical protein
VLRLIADGLSDGEIAERLIVNPHTVHRHVANIRMKLWQPSRVAAPASARTCSMKSRRPPGCNTRRASSIAAGASPTVHSTIVDTTVSNEASGNGTASAAAPDALASTERRSMRRSSRARIASSGSLRTSSRTAGP